MRDHPVIPLIKPQLVHTKPAFFSIQGHVTQHASQEKIKDPNETIQLTRAVSIAWRDTGRRVIYWDWSLLISAKALLQKFLMSWMKSGLKERERKKPTTLEKLLVRTRKLHGIAHGLWETQLQVPNLIQAQWKKTCSSLVTSNLYRLDIYCCYSLNPCYMVVSVDNVNSLDITLVLMSSRHFFH